MAGNIDYVRKKFAPMLDKTLENALAHRIGQEFPRMGGGRIQKLCAQMVLEVVDDHLRPTEHIRHGQILWLAISVDDPPSRGKHIADTDLVPVVLDAHIAQDIENRISRIKLRERIEQKAIRLCHQAYEQKAQLSNCDLAEILNTQESTIAHLLSAYEARTEQIIPRRATIHDVGTGLTHKRIICRKHYIDGKLSQVIARETYHSIEAVDRYLGQYDRVQHCQQQGLSPQETAYTLKCSLRLVNEYLSIVGEIEQGRRG